MNKPSAGCEECGTAFEVSAAEQSIAAKVFAPDLPIPPIRKCPDCRMRQRLAFRNERKLYRRTCGLSGRSIISVYRPETPYQVYEQSEWWSDKYDPLELGREIDFTRPFFEQVAELHLAVPKLSIHNAKSENCEYTNYSAENRNCYLAVGALGAEDVYYSYRVFYSKNIVDCFGLSKSELCYESMQGVELYDCVHSTNCQSSHDLFLCEDCIGCRDCFGCVNLRNKQYYILNQPFTADEYIQKLMQLRSDSNTTLEAFRSLRESVPERSAYTTNCESCDGDQIRDCRRCSDVFFIADSEDVLHSRNGENNRDCVDINFGDNCELQYQASNLEKNYRVAFAALAWYVTDSCYVLSCFNSKHLFGCCGMKRNEHCILNRQYSADEYQRTVKKLVAHMVDTGEWGNFFPASLSPFLFSETVAAEQFPLSDVECAKRGFHAGPPPERPEPVVANESLPACVACGRLFRMIPQEMVFYETAGLPLPKRCPDCRHAVRHSMRRPMILRPGICDRCSTPVQTSSPAAKVFCERCYSEAAL